MYRNFVVTMITPVAISTIGYQYYIVFTIIGFCIPVSVYFLYPEVSIHNSIWLLVPASVHKLTGSLSPRPWVSGSRTSI